MYDEDDVYIDGEGTKVIPDKSSREYLKRLDRAKTIPCAYCLSSNCIEFCKDYVEWYQTVMLGNRRYGK